MFRKNLCILLILTPLLFAQSVNDYNKEQMKAFENQKKLFTTYKDRQAKEFEAYKKAQEKVFYAYKKDIKAIWETPKMPTKTHWIAYSKDKKTRSDVDFSNKTIIVETIASSQKEAQKKLQETLKKIVTIDNKTFNKTDPLEQMLLKVKKPFGMVDGMPKNEPIISNMIFKNPPKNKDIEKYISKNIKKSKIKIHKTSKQKKQKVYTIKIKMPKDALVRKSKQYYKDVKTQALKQRLPVSLVFAIMHSESSFNPRARSYIPAYGLMQIVPRTAGIDAYNYLYKEKKLISSGYLYNSKNNIMIGTAYLHILYYRYLKTIKNPKSRLYCTIAAYNTGAGNIAWAFTKTHSIYKASRVINKMTAQEVYNKLLRDLKYEEPKIYLRKVSKRISTYHKVYGS